MLIQMKRQGVDCRERKKWKKMLISSGWNKYRGQNLFTIKSPSPFLSPLPPSRPPCLLLSPTHNKKYISTLVRHPVWEGASTLPASSGACIGLLILSQKRRRGRGWDGRGGEERRRCKVMINYSIRILCYFFFGGSCISIFHV